MSDYFTDASELARAITMKKISPKEVVLETIDRIEKLNPYLNAVVSKQYEKALEDSINRDFRGKPFGGVPILLKDLGQEEEGELVTSGSPLFKNYRAKQTSHYVRRLKDMGFIVLGRTNTPEFGFKNISDSRLHGVANLPDDWSRNAGGSSGGAAAVVSAGIVPIAAASDGGGSIRIPASFNGLIGLKPTRGRIPVGPGSYRGWQGASVNFAMTKSVRDTKRLLYYLQTCQMESPFVLPKLSEKTLFKNSNSPLKIAVLFDSPIGSALSDDAKKALQKAIAFFNDDKDNVEVLTKQPLDGFEAMKTYYLMNSVETAAMFDKIGAGMERALNQDDMELMTWAIYQSGKSILAKTYSKLLNRWDYYSEKMANFHKKYDIILTPTVNQVAPKHGEFNLDDDLKIRLSHITSASVSEQQDLIWEMFEKSLSWTPFTQQSNLTGQPAISLPIYRNQEGLSLGVQLIAAKGREDILLNIAQKWEDEKRFL